MSRASLFRLALGATLLIGFGAAADKPKSSQPVQLDEKIRDLMQQVSSLTRENIQLKEQVRSLQLRLAEDQLRIVPAPNQVPENWRRREINGLTFYLVPLGAGRPATTQPVR